MKDEKFQLSPDEVANLDPFGIRATNSSSELESVLEIDGKTMEETIKFNDYLIYKEKESWNKVLGATPEIKPLPDIVTPELIPTLITNGFALRYIPEFPLKYDDLKDTTQAILQKCQKAYPNWKPFYLLRRRDYHKKETVNLDGIYWQSIRDGRMSIPPLNGKWVAVEKFILPPLNNTKKLLGIENRNNLSFTQVSDLLAKKQENILNILKIANPLEYVRLPFPFEYNLLANREKWCIPNYSEWVAGKYRSSESNHPFNLTMGDLDKGGAGDIETLSPNFKLDNVGFRILIPLI